MKQPDLGKKILELRLAKGLTQGELAEKCNLSLRTIQRIESAEVTPRSYTVKLIFSCLEYEIYDSFGKFSYKLDRSAYRVKNLFEQFYKYVFNLLNLKTNTMRKVTTLVAAFSLIAAGIFLSTKSNAQSASEVKKVIEGFNADFIENFNKGEIEAMFNMYRSDACTLPSDCCGESCIKQHWRNELAKGYKFVALKTVSLSLSDTIAVEKGEWKIAWSAGPEMEGMYLSEWRFSDNQWKIVNDISGIRSVNPPTAER